MIPELPDGITPGSKFFEKWISLNYVSGLRKCEIAGTLYFITQKLNILAAGCLIIKPDLHALGTGSYIQRDVGVPSGVFCAREMVRCR
jgi:hypothetical protein